jgi:hypothetical protein
MWVSLYFLEVAKINYREQFDVPYLLLSIATMGMLALPVAILMPALGMILPRAIMKHGSPQIIGTVSGIARLFMSVGSGAGPFLSAACYAADKTMLLTFYGTSACLALAMAIMGNLISTFRPGSPPSLSAPPPHTFA